MYKDNGAKIVLVTPNTTDDKVYHQYKDNNLIDDAIAVPEMYGETAGQAIAAGVKANGGEFHCVFSHFEQLQPLCGEVAELIGVKHNPLSAYANARDKYATRVALEKAGVPTPLQFICSQPDCFPKLRDGDRRGVAVLVRWLAAGLCQRRAGPAAADAPAELL